MEAHQLMKLFKSIDVWRRRDDQTLVRYRCLQLLPDGGYCVQSADFYHQPPSEAQQQNLDRQFLELLAEQSPDERDSLHPTLEGAIEAHDKEFGTA